jgi:pimeloyl-ACP methyl ester carboxylesterase
MKNLDPLANSTFNQQKYVSGSQLTTFFLFTLFLLIAWLACSPRLLGKNPEYETALWYDSLRLREIPVAFYWPNKSTKVIGVVVFNHGYGQNQPNSHIAYSYLTTYLAQKGFLVISIQHELASDSLLPLQGNPQIVRRSNWERGAKNIDFVIGQIRQRYPITNSLPFQLVGHSNGGDMSVLYASLYPKKISKVITLDHRRLPVARTKEPSFYSLRSVDQTADIDVLPSVEEQKQFNIRITQLKSAHHNGMDDSGTPEEHEEVKFWVLRYLLE